MSLPGVTWIVGCPQSGKTTLARAEAVRLSAQRGWPVLVLDAGQVHNLSNVPDCSVRECGAALWDEPRGHARVVPQSLADIDECCRMVYAGKRVVLLVDEAHHWLSAQSGCSSSLVRLMRATQHAECELLLTTQHLTGDVPQVALSCTSRLCVFRCTAPRVLRTLEAEFGFDRRAVAGLEQFKYLELRIGF